MFDSDQKPSHPTIRIKSPNTLTIPPRDRVDHQMMAVTKLRRKMEAPRPVCLQCGMEMQQKDVSRCCGCGKVLCCQCSCEDEGEVFCLDCFDDVREQTHFPPI